MATTFRPILARALLAVSRINLGEVDSFVFTVRFGDSSFFVESDNLGNDFSDLVQRSFVFGRSVEDRTELYGFEVLFATLDETSWRDFRLGLTVRARDGA